MTSSKLKFRPSRINGKAGPLYIRVIHGRIVRQINLGYKIFPHEWKKGRVLIPEQKSERLHYLLPGRTRRFTGKPGTAGSYRPTFQSVG